MEIEFNSLNELYERLKPALLTKTIEMRRNGYEYIKEEDIWNYLKDVKWVKSVDLELYEMVSDVLDTEDIEIDTFVRKRINVRNKTTN